MTKRSRERKRRERKKRAQNLYGKRLSDSSLSSVYLRVITDVGPQEDLYHISAQSKQKFYWKTEGGSYKRMSVKAAVEMFAQPHDTPEK